MKNNVKAGRNKTFLRHCVGYITTQ